MNLEMGSKETTIQENILLKKKHISQNALKTRKIQWH